MARNKMQDLRNHCFAALERLNDETLKPEEIEREIDRAESIAKVAQVLVNSAKVEVDFIRQTGAHKSEFLQSAKELNS